MKLNKSKIIEEAKKEKASIGAGTIAGGAALGAGALAAKTGMLGKAGALAGKAGALTGKAGVVGKAGLAALKAGKSGGAVYLPGEDWKKSALYSGLGSAAGTALINGVGSALGSGVPMGAVAVGSGMAGLKGAALGGGMQAYIGKNKNRDSLLLNTAIPAAVVAGSAPLTNMAFDAAGYPNIEVDPGMSAALTAGAGALGWYLRNRNNKNKSYFGIR